MEPVTPKKGKKRLQIGATGLTPKSKQTSSTRPRAWLLWTPGEKEALHKFVCESGGSKNTSWNKCAEYINNIFGNNRSAKACQRYSKNKTGIFHELSSEKDENTDDSLCNLCDIAVQTDKSFSPGVEVRFSIDDVSSFTISTPIRNQPVPTLREALLASPIFSSSLYEDQPACCPQTTDNNVYSKCGEDSNQGYSTFQGNIHKSLSSNSIATDHSYISQNLNVIEPTNVENRDFPKPCPVKKGKMIFKLKKQTRKRHLRSEPNLDVAKEISSNILQHNFPLNRKEVKKLQSIVNYTSNTEVLAATFLSIPKLKIAIQNQMALTAGYIPERMKNRIHGNVSVLMKKNRKYLESLKLSKVVLELFTLFPELGQLLVHIMIPQEHLHDVNKLDNIIPHLSMIYAIIMQCRNSELSLMQRIVSLFLMDCVVDQKVFDRLNSMGVCLSYERTMDVVKHVGGYFKDDIKNLVKQGKRLKLVGDNLNFSVNVADERYNRHGHMNHWFLSMAVLYDSPFTKYANKPEIDLDRLNLSHVLLSCDEYEMLRLDVITFVTDIMKQHFPQLQHLTSFQRKTNDKKTFDKTTVIRLPAWALNEQKYPDVVKILENYQDIVNDIYSDLPEHCKHDVNIGGDQLTRERFSNAKNLRLGNRNHEESFSILNPITFEFFHLCMNFLEKVIFRRLYNSQSDMELGTMKCQANRLNRKNVNADVCKAYDDNKDFFVSFYKAYIVEGLMHHFSLNDTNDLPTGAPLPGSDQDAQNSWLEEKVGCFVDTYIYPEWSGRAKKTYAKQGENIIHDVITVDTEKGQKLKMLIRQKEIVIGPQQPDKVKDYSHLVLEIGTLYYHLMELCKSPSRQKILALLKMIMLVLKCNNNQSKYALEVLRLLIQQYSLLPEREARQCFFQQFINTKGKYNTHVPCDLVMEWHVKEEKRHIKHMFSNKSESNILTRSAALGGIEKISKNFDMVANVRMRSQVHKTLSAVTDEARIIEDLRQLKPWDHTPGRAHLHFRHIPSTMLKYYDGFHFNSWFNKHKCLIDD